METTVVDGSLKQPVLGFFESDVRYLSTIESDTGSTFGSDSFDLRWNDFGVFPI